MNPITHDMLSIIVGHGGTDLALAPCFVMSVNARLRLNKLVHQCYAAVQVLLSMLCCQ